MNTADRTSEQSLLDRYVHAATRSLPDEQRADVGDELRGTLADRVESLLAQEPGLTREQAEHTAVAELGDPERLAADYAGRRQHLIGPELFHTWWRTLRAILLVAVPTATVAIAVIDALDGTTAGGVIGGAAWTAFVLAVQISFWTTVFFALVERSGRTSGEDRAVAPWKPDDLPAVPSRRGSLGDLVTGAAVLLLIGAALVWQQFASPMEDGEERLPLLDPDLWSFWIPLILVLIVVEIGFEAVKYLSGWSRDLAIANTVLGLLFALPWVYLAATDRLLSPAAVARIQEDWAGFDPGTVNTLVIVSALLIWAWDTVDGWRRATATG